MKKQIDLYLLTGFLGAGKTTVLKEILKGADDRKIGIVMNEFGKTGIDGKLVSDRSAELIEINRGSIFCDCLKLSFIESLKDMSDKPIDTLFVEGSGLADPSNIGEILEAAESLVGDVYQYKGAICVVDASHFLEQSKDIEAMNRQVKYSHLAVISKSDLVETPHLNAVKEKVSTYNQGIEVVEAEYGKLPFNVLQRNYVQGKPLVSAPTTNKKENKPKTLTLSIFEPVPFEGFEKFLQAVSHDAYRMKGHVEFDGKGVLQVDVVNTRVDYKKTEETYETQLVILSKVGPQIIRSLVSMWETHVDVPYKLRN